jgi:subtilisin family serine protease
MPFTRQPSGFSRRSNSPNPTTRPCLAILGLAAAVCHVISVQAQIQTSAANAVSTNAHASATHSYSHIVTLRPEADQDRCANEHKIARGRSFRRAINGFEANLDDAAVDRLKRDQRVRAVERNGNMAPCLLYFPQQTNSGVRIGTLQFPITRIDNRVDPLDVDVAVFDTGIDNTHPDLNVVQMADFTGEGRNGFDWNGHGTGVAGILGAIDNIFGVFGTAPNVRLWSIQVIGRVNSAWANFIAGCDYVIQRADKISVANASMGPVAGSLNLPYEATHESVSNVVSKGIVFVAAAGNNGEDITGVDGVWGVNPTNGLSDDFIPAACPEVAAVSAMDPVTNVLPSWSNHSSINKVPRYVISAGAGIDVAAPGVNIYSTWPTDTNGYTFMNGTSAASPHVAGLVALYIAMHERATNAAGVYAIRRPSSMPPYLRGTADGAWPKRMIRIAIQSRSPMPMQAWYPRHRS